MRNKSLDNSYIPASDNPNNINTYNIVLLVCQVGLHLITNVYGYKGN